MKNRHQETMRTEKDNARPAEKRLKKKHAVIITGCILSALAVIYLAFAIFFQSHFCFGTTIDGIKVGGRSADKVEQLIKEEIDGYSLELVERESGKESISGSSVGIAPVFNGEVEALLKEQNGFAWIAKLFTGEELELAKVVSYDEKLLEEVLDGLSCTKDENQKEPVDAGYSEYSAADGYVLVPADYGTKIDMEALKRAAVEAIMVLDDELDLDESGCYVEPEVTDDDERLLSLIDDLNRYVGTEITYDFGDKKEVLDGSVINTWLSDEDWKVSVDREKVSDYVKSLGKTYNTAYKPKTLKTSYGTTVTISNGSYGWRIDNPGETEQIVADLAEGGKISREPVYLQRANSHGENDYGDSYVEINLTAQHLFVYENGKLVTESDFVSGNLAKGHASPTGAFGLTYKTTDAVLRGEDYETPVKYWMPFAGDVGMHDATWRKSFGGNIYKTGGSHGCINLPFSVAKTIYGVVEKGYAVLVYTLPGTESTSVQKQDASAVVDAINIIGPVTLESENAINHARNLYNGLSDSAKGYVTNYDVLTAAEAALAQLKGQAAPPADQPQDQAPADQPQDQPQDQAPADQPQDQAPADQPQAG